MLGHRVLPPQSLSLSPSDDDDEFDFSDNKEATEEHKEEETRWDEEQPLADEEQEAILASYEMARQQPNAAQALMEANAAIMARAMEISTERVLIEDNARILMEVEQQQILELNTQTTADHVHDIGPSCPAATEPKFTSFGRRQQGGGGGGTVG
jgi:hypothetical protein